MGFIKMLTNIKFWDDAISKYKSKVSLLLDDRSFQEAFNDMIKDTVSEFKMLIYKIKNLRQTNYELGMMHYNEGNMQDAILRFKMLALFCTEEIGELNYFLGRSYIERNRLDKAKVYLDRYLASGHTDYLEEAEYNAKIAANDASDIKAIPKGVVRRIFDILAPKYDEIFISPGNTPQDEIYKTIVWYFSKSGHPYGNKILDLGCGSGYIGKMLKNSKIAFAIEGVDISKKMIEKCAALKIDDMPCYDALFHEDIDDFLATKHDELFDVIIASSLFNFYSNIDFFLKKIAVLLKKDGFLAISFKITEEKNVRYDYFLEEFSYNPRPLEEMVINYGFKIETKKDILFADGDKGMIWVIIKN